MARKNVIGVSANVTPKQYQVITELKELFGVGEAQLVRMALALFVTNNNREWPTAEIKRGAKPHPSENEVHKIDY